MGEIISSTGPSFVGENDKLLTPIDVQQELLDSTAALLLYWEFIINHGDFFIHISSPFEKHHIPASQRHRNYSNGYNSFSIIVSTKNIYAELFRAKGHP